MFKRIIPLVAVLSLLVAMFVVPASAVDTVINGQTVIDYNDYVTNVVVDGDNDLVTVELPESMYGVHSNDWYGVRFLKGQHSGALTVLKNDSKVETAGLYYPGGSVTHTFLDMSNIPEDSVFNLSCKIFVAPPDDGINFFDFSGEYWATIEYRDENFEYCGNTSTERTRYNIGSLWKELKLSPDLPVRKPARAKYATIYFRFNVDSIEEYTEKYQIYYDFDIPQLKMSISSLYRLQEQTGKTNELLADVNKQLVEQGKTMDDILDQQEDTNNKLDNIINGEVNSESPSGSDNVGDLDDVEGALKDDTSAGRDEAEKVFNESWGLVVVHTAGFMFLSAVIERMIGVGWLRGILTVSLSLGIFAFIVNIASTVGNKLSSKGGKSGKGGKP